MPRIIMPRELRSRYINPLAVAGSFFSFDPRVTLSSWRKDYDHESCDCDKSIRNEADVYTHNQIRTRFPDYENISDISKGKSETRNVISHGFRIRSHIDLSRMTRWKGTHFTVLGLYFHSVREKFETAVIWIINTRMLIIPMRLMEPEFACPTVTGPDPCDWKTSIRK